MTVKKVACPCCGHLTLEERGAFDICSVCFWEDDGQDDVDAHISRGGPNRGSLWQARTNFLLFGACEEVALKHVRSAREDEPAVRRWFLLDGRAVELIPSTDISPWNLLHDGSIEQADRRGERLSLTIDICYLREMFREPGSFFTLELLGVSEFIYTPYDEAVVTKVDEIVAADIEILSADGSGGIVEVCARGFRDNGGTIRLGYSALAIRFDTGESLALAALEQAAGQYWEQFANQKK